MLETAPHKGVVVPAVYYGRVLGALEHVSHARYRAGSLHANIAEMKHIDELRKQLKHQIYGDVKYSKYGTEQGNILTTEDGRTYEQVFVRDEYIRLECPETQIVISGLCSQARLLKQSASDKLSFLQSVAAEKHIDEMYTLAGNILAGDLESKYQPYMLRSAYSRK